MSGKSLGSVLNEIPAKEREIARGKNEAIEFTKRRYRDAKETMEMLKESLLDFSEEINPITVQTMMMLVGDESLQFRFVDVQNKPIENFQFRYDEENKWLITENKNTYLQHLTLGIKDITSEEGKEYKTWQMPADGWKSAPLDANQKCYLYARCSKTGSTGIFETSPTAIAMDTEGEPDYYFLVGILNSEFEKERSFVTLYGFTEILPGRITTDRVVSGDGESYLDLARNAFRIGDEKSSLSWNIDENKQLSIENANFEIENEDNEVVAKIDGQSGAALFGKGSIELRADGAAAFGNEKNVFNADGSGSLANNNILFDANGNLIVTGKYQSAETKERFVIDPQEGNLKMYNDKNQLISYLSYDSNWRPEFVLRSYDSNGNMYSRTALTHNGLDILMGSLVVQGGPIYFTAVPKDRNSVDKYQLYLDGETLKIKMSTE